MDNPLTHLRQFIAEHYDLEDLRTLCFDLGVDYDELGGEGKTVEARAGAVHRTAGTTGPVCRRHPRGPGGDAHGAVRQSGSGSRRRRHRHRRLSLHWGGRHGERRRLCRA
jgi:hypothetical protein